MTTHATDVLRHLPHSHRSASFLALAGIFTVACIGAIEPLPSTTGALLVSVSTAGANSDVDADGYTLSIDSEPAQAVGVNALVTIGSLSRGAHVVRLDGLSTNCSVAGGNRRSVNVVSSRPDSPVSISFSVSCVGDGSGSGWWDY
jgi:hypothetical protein